MARYLITYLIGDSETIEANSVNLDGDQYVFHQQDRQYAPVAFVPQGNVVSVVRQDSNAEASVTYPYQDGDVTVLGPEVFASTDGEAISWRGTNYTRGPYRPLGKVTG